MGLWDVESEVKRDASLHSSHWEKTVSDGQYEVTSLPAGLRLQCESAVEGTVGVWVNSAENFTGTRRCQNVEIFL